VIVGLVVPPVTPGAVAYLAPPDEETTRGDPAPIRRRAA